MAHLSVEQRVDRLTERVDRLEGEVRSSFFARVKDSFNDLTPRDSLHIGGWLLVTVCVLTLVAHLSYDGTFSVSASLGLFVGFWMVAYESRWPHLSRSTRDLLRESLSQRTLSSRSMHHSHKVRGYGDSPDSVFLLSAGYLGLVISVLVGVVVYAWLIATYVPVGSWQVLGALAIPTIAMAYSMYANKGALYMLSLVASLFLLLVSQAPVFSISYLTAFAIVSVAYAWLTARWEVLLVTVVGSYLVLGSWSLSSGVAGLHSLILLSALFLSLIFVVPFAGVRRTLEGRQLIKASLFIATAGFVLLSVMIRGDIVLLTDWLLAAAIYMTILVCLGVLALLRHGRFSYAKYYLLSSVALIMLVTLLIGSSALTSLVWFVLSILLLGLGFAVSSYTVRTAGLMVLGSTLLFYLVNVFAYDTVIGGPVILQERIWLGGIFVLFLPVLSFWYKDLPAGEPEDGEKPFIIESLYVLSFFLLFGITWVGLVPPFQTLLWCLIGGVYLVWARYQKLPVTQSVAIASIVTSLGKFFFVDTQSLDNEQRAIFLVVICFVGLLTSLLLLHLGRERGHITKRTHL